jgi:hypothetical protein
VSTAETVRYLPTRDEARAVAANKSRDIILDKHDLATMSQIAADIEEYANDPRRVRELRGELSSFLDFLRLQLP